VIRAALDAELPALREVFREYAASIGNAVCFQAFDAEVAGLPGHYAGPDGRILVAVEDGAIAGCVALRRRGDGVCEMKRLYVRPQYRGTGLGRALAAAAIMATAEIGYAVLRLDTLPSMTRAISLYRAMGFMQIPPYGGNPEGAICFELDVKNWGTKNC